MGNRKTKNMTEGSTLKLLLSFAFPLFIGNIFQQLYNMVDSIVVGNVLGANSLAAVGACGSLHWLFFSLASGLAGGIGVIVAQFFGAGNEKRVQQTIQNAIYILGTTAIVVSGLAYAIAPQVLRLLGTPGDIIAESIIYLRTTCMGMVFVAAYNGAANILYALGNSRTPLMFLIISSILNTVLDILFVKTLGMGVFGAALATVVAQFMVAVSCIVYARKTIYLFRIPAEYKKPDPEIIKSALKIGTPIAMQSSLIAISCLILQNVVNSFGATVVATFTITSRIEQLVQQPYNSLGSAVSNYTGQNMGAGLIDRVKKGYRVGLGIALTFTALMFPLAFFFGRYLIAVFVREPEVIEMGSMALKITSACFFPLCTIYIPRALLNGAGDAKFSIINGLAEIVGRVVFAYLFTGPLGFGHWGVWMTTGATWIIVSIVCHIRYRSGIWMHKGIVTQTEGRTS